jgi:hypothetical protein
MARYIQTAMQGQEEADRLFALLPEEHREEGAKLIARMVNWGVRCCPRSAQATVRLNIVATVCKNLPIRCSMEKRDRDDGQGQYNALQIAPKAAA